MAKKNRFKNFKENVKEVIEDYKGIFKDFYSDLIDGSNGGLPPIEHFLAVTGTVGLILGSVAFANMGAFFPAILFAFGGAAWGTDEVYHLSQKESSIVSRCLTNIVAAIISPPLLIVGYPLVKLGLAIHESLEERREARLERREAKRAAKEAKDYTHGYDMETYSNEPSTNTILFEPAQISQSETTTIETTAIPEPTPEKNTPESTLSSNDDGMTN